ncbi:MAG: hypothetical protein RLO01_12575 [Thalassobaculaceae bacterium]
MISNALRTLALAGCIGLAGLVSACNPDDAAKLVKEASFATAKSVAGEVVADALAGDTKGRTFIVLALSEYCDRVAADRRASFRLALAADGRPAVTVDCDVVRAIAPDPSDISHVTIEPPSDRRALALLRGAGAPRAGQG